MTTREVEAPATAPVGTRGLIACLSFAALTGSVVAGLGNPIILEVSTERHVSPDRDAPHAWAGVIAPALSSPRRMA